MPSPFRSPPRKQIMRLGPMYRDTILNRGGPSPKDVLLANMWFHWNRVKFTEQKLTELGSAEVLLTNDARSLTEHAATLYARHLEARRDATEAAKEAAPYFHPKLAAVKVKVTEADPSNLGDAELLEALQTLDLEDLGIEPEAETADINAENVD